MNSGRLRDLIANFKKVNVEEERVRYATERFLKRLEKSEYHKNFIVKGGFLLGLLYDVSQRTTKDLDTLMRNIYVDENNVEGIIKKIISIDLKDGVYFDLVKIYETQNERKYKGQRVNLIMYFLGEKTRIDFSLDIGIGDVVEPNPVLKEFPLRFNETKGEIDKIKLLSYTKESIFAEKLETILSLGSMNTRMKDFYDIHLILRGDDAPKMETLYLAFKRTWENRHPNLKIEEELFLDWKFTIKEDVRKSEQMKIWWGKYIKDREYASGISFEEILKRIDEVIEAFYILFRDDLI